VLKERWSPGSVRTSATAYLHFFHTFHTAEGLRMPVVDRYYTLGQVTQRAERRAEYEDVPHERPSCSVIVEVVIVIEPGEGAAHHAVAEVTRAVVLHDLSRQLLDNTEMTRSPRHVT
jgi:hypothetical protein